MHRNAGNFASMLSRFREATRLEEGSGNSRWPGSDLGDE
jgi:hypothetical protein